MKKLLRLASASIIVLGACSPQSPSNAPANPAAANSAPPPQQAGAQGVRAGVTGSAARWSARR